MEDRIIPERGPLKFVRGNAKLASDIYTFALPAGFTCPGAHLCMARFMVDLNKIVDGPAQTHRCSAASEEWRPSVRNLRWRNFNLLKAARTFPKMRDLIDISLPPGARTTRPHTSGDFFNKVYIQAWMDVMERRWETEFYAYTKSVRLFIDYLEESGGLPSNFSLNISEGGTDDSRIPELMSKMEALGCKRPGLATVVFHPDQARALGLETDHDESHARAGGLHFALLLHGTQPRGTKAAESIRIMRQEKVAFSYPKKKRPVEV